jgi:hypothetical protein
LAFDTTEPTRSASNTVVMPTLASSASCAMIAAAWGQSTLGRGSMWRSRLSVCSSIRPGITRSPPQSSAPSGTELPCAMSAIRPSTIRT